MAVEVTDNRARLRYEITEDGELVGFATYKLVSDGVDILHAEVDPDFGGRGLAGVLVRAALDDVRSRGLHVIPHCPYVTKFIDGHRDEYLDLVPEARRAQFGLTA